MRTGLERPPLVTNVTDTEQVRRAGRVERQRDEMRQATLRAVLKTREGRWLLWDVLERTGLYETSLDRDPHQVYAREGRRNFGLELLDLILRTDTDRYLEMEREARARQQHEDRATLALRGAAEPSPEPPAEETLGDA